jgi:hypothetical protein
MAKKFAVLDGDQVLNTILADSKAIAEELTGKTCVEFTDQPAEVGGTYTNGKFVRIKPYPSWVYDGANNWSPPVPYPIDQEGSFEWNEETVSWVAVVSEQ